MPQSHSSGSAGTVPPGSLGVWVNGEMSIIQAGHCSGGPNTVITPASATALHASAGGLPRQQPEQQDSHRRQ